MTVNTLTYSFGSNKLQFLHLKVSICQHIPTISYKEERNVRGNKRISVLPKVKSSEKYAFLPWFLVTYMTKVLCNWKTIKILFRKIEQNFSGNSQKAEKISVPINRSLLFCFKNRSAEKYDVRLSSFGEMTVYQMSDDVLSLLHSETIITFS
jgi:hypothetical protein